MTKEQIEALATLLATNPTSQSQAPVNLGKCIIIADKGFVYVGNVAEYPDHIYMTDAKNIRRWGTTKGVGQLLNGPLEHTILEHVGNLKIYRNSVIVIMPCPNWK